MPELSERLKVPAQLRATTHALVRNWSQTPGRDPDEATSSLASGIVDDQLHVAYQPVVDLTDGRLVAVEALVRFEPAPREALSDAGRIIAVAERSGLIVALGHQVLTSACTQLAEWRKLIPELQVHVNASPIELREPGYVERVREALASTGLVADALVIEITETAALDRDDDSQQVLLALATHGVEIALDDFGTGFASLDLLAATPANMLKLDRSFVSALGDEQAHLRGRATVVQAAIGLGRSLGLRIVGEGIESASQARQLLSWGCHLGQGFLYGRPVRAEDLDLRLAGSIAPTGSPTIAREQPLSPDAIDVGIGLANVLTAIDTDRGARRADALAVASIIAGTLGSDRRRAETASLLATLGDAPARLRELTGTDELTNGAVHELIQALSVAPIIGRDTTAGAIARTAWALAISRANGDEAPDPALLAAHPDPAVDTELRARVGSWWTSTEPSTPARDALLALEQRLHARDDADRRLRSLVGLARAIGSEGKLEDVLEVTAEEARRVLGASSLSISRLEPEAGILRVLVNVGELADWEEIRPTDEVYELSWLAEVHEQVMQRSIHFEQRDDSGPRNDEQEMLSRLGKGSSATVPVVVNNMVWGEMHATTDVGAPAFTVADGPFLSAVASFVGVAITRAEDVGRLARLADEDPLTRLANRRKLDQHVTELLRALGPGESIALAIADIVELKEVNDAYGHTVGDQLLIATADTLQRAVVAEPDGLAARLGSDEFCLVARVDRVRLERVAQRALARLAEHTDPRPRLTVGIIEALPSDRTLGDLLARADEIQFSAKRRGVEILTDASETASTARSRRRPWDRRRRDRQAPRMTPTQHALRDWASALTNDDHAIDRSLEAIGELAFEVLHVQRWGLCVAEPGASSLELRRVHVRTAEGEYGPHPPPAPEQFDLDAFPASRDVLIRKRGLYRTVNDHDPQTPEHRMLEQFGATGLILLCEHGTDGRRWMLAIYLDESSAPIDLCIPLLDTLCERTFGHRMLSVSDEPADG